MVATSRQVADVDLKTLTGEFTALAQGDLNRSLQITARPLSIDRRDEIGQMARTFNEMLLRLQEAATAFDGMTSTLSAMANETQALSQAAVEGRLAVRGNATRFEGGYRRILEGINDTLDAVIGPLGLAAGYIERIGKGDIPPKITEHYDGDYDSLMRSLNDCIDGLGGLVESNAVLQRVAVNDLTVGVAGTYQGIFAEVAAAVNETREGLLRIQETAVNVARGNLQDLPEYKALGGGTGRLSENDQLAPAFIGMMEAIEALVSDADALAKTAVAGNLAARADSSRHNGDYRRVIDGVNATLDALITPLNMSAEYVDRISKGDIPPKITETYQGDFNELKNNLNTCIDAVNRLVRDDAMLAKAAVEGRFEARADAGSTRGSSQDRRRGQRHARHGGGQGLLVREHPRPSPSRLGHRSGDALDVHQPADRATAPEGARKTVWMRDCIGTKEVARLKNGDHQTAFEQKVSRSTRPRSPTDGASGSPHRGRPGRQGSEGANTSARRGHRPAQHGGRIRRSDQQGRHPATIAETWQGDFNELKTNRRHLQRGGRRAGRRCGACSRSSRSRALSVTASTPPGTRASIRKVIDGVNSTLDAVVKPVQEAATVLATVAVQDLSAKVTGDYAGDHAAMKNSINTMVEDLRRSIQQIAQNADALGASSLGLGTVAKQMTGNAEETSTQVNVVSAASEQVSKNLSVVATSSEEMLASIREIAKSANEAAKMAKQRRGGGRDRPTRRCRSSATPRPRSATSSRSSRRSPSRPTCWRSTPPSRRRAPATRARASPWWPTRSRSWPRRPPRRPRTSAGRSRRSRATPRARSPPSARSARSSRRSTTSRTRSRRRSRSRRRPPTRSGGTSPRRRAARREIARNVAGVALAAQGTTRGATDTQQAARALGTMATQLQAIVGKFSV